MVDAVPGEIPEIGFAVETVEVIQENAGLVGVENGVAVEENAVEAPGIDYDQAYRQEVVGDGAVESWGSFFSVIKVKGKKIAARMVLHTMSNTGTVPIK